MKRWGKWGILAAAIGAVVTLAAQVVISQQPPPAAATTPPSPTSLDELFEKARPSLEESLGTKLDFRPQFRAVPAEQLLATPDGELDGHLHWHFPHLQGETLARTRKIAGQIVGSATVAQYVEGSESILVVTDNLPTIAAWDPELASVNSEGFLQLALVYEVVRCHLDRQYQLGKLRASCRDAEEFESLQTVVEGRAQFITRQIASKLGSQALFPLLAERYLRVPDEAPDSSIKAVSQTALHARFRASTQGMAFWDALPHVAIETGVFARLPRQMTVIGRPDLWLAAQAKNQPDLVAALTRLEAALPADQWQPMQQTWTPTMLAQVASMLGGSKERAEKIAKTWYEGRSLIWTQRRRPDLQVALSVVRHDGDAGARAYFGFAVDLQRKQDTLPPGSCGPTIRVIESKSTALKLEGFDEAVRNEKRLAFGDAEPIPVSLLLARAGSLVIECTWHGETADPALAEKLAQAVRRAAE